MQSDERVKAALAALQPRIAQYRYAVSSTLDRAKGLLTAEPGSARAGIALGNFASGRIDPERFAMISEGAQPLDVIGRAVLERSVDALGSLLASGDDLFLISVPAGTSPGAAIHARLARIGSAFSVAALVELVRRRMYDPQTHGLPFNEHAFEKWTTGERRLAPPLIVRLSGADLDPFDLARFVDGSMQLVLFVDDPCAPAALARLISPGVFVAQAAQAADVPILEKLPALDGPAVVGVMNGAQFVHDPRAASTMWQRIRVDKMSDARIRKPIGARSAQQMREDVAHLAALAAEPVFPRIAGSGPTAGMSVDPAERLTAWLLEQSSIAAVS